jgi:site-specific recombinase XerD
MSRLNSLFEQFLRERAYLKNVTPKTRTWYESAWKAYRSVHVADRPDGSPLITRADLSQFVISLRERGVKPVSCNTWLRALNAFCRWLHEQGEAPSAVKLPPQRLEKRLTRTHDDAILRAILTSKPKDYAQWRVYAVACTILDTGCRIDEVLTAPDQTSTSTTCS